MKIHRAPGLISLVVVGSLACLSPIQTAAKPAGPGDIVRPFDPPSNPYGPGHRGIDVAGQVGTPVEAIRSGTVCFAGRVADTSSVSVCHEDSTRTTYTPLTPLVRVGLKVKRGDPLGILLPGHLPNAEVVHIGWRSGQTYLDPAVLLGRDTRQVRLMPWDGPG